MKHDNECSSNDNIFVSQRGTYAKHWSLQSAMVIQYQCVLVTQLWSEEMGGGAPGSCVHFLHVLCSEKLPIN